MTVSEDSLSSGPAGN